ncbi:MAG: T9SS type A sorting domain-containing protein, partial [Candidatus Poribacteria bacterium]|nr:T9SS type A sorting domain-containing protein [Candidatus Poribacteria bacterium]
SSIESNTTLNLFAVTGGKSATTQLTITGQDSTAEITSVAVELLRNDEPSSFTAARAGDDIRVTLVGEGGGTASFSIENVPAATGLVMTAGQSGTYVGVYSVLEIDNAENTVITVTLQDGAGNTNTDSSTQVTIDNEPPPAPQNLAVTGGAITLTNVSNVEVTGEATGNRTVTVVVADGASNSLSAEAIADAAGAFSAEFNLAIFVDGLVLVSVFEASDDAGNNGEIRRTNVIKNTSPTGPEVSFALASPIDPIQSVSPGESATYLIQVISQQGFEGAVSLLAANLPLGAAGTFNIAEVQLTADQPTQTVQLTVATLDSLAIRDYQFTVIGQGPQSTSENLTLTLKVEAKAKTDAFLTVRTSPSEGSLGESLLVLGNLIRPNATTPSENLVIVLTYTLPSGEQIEQQPTADDQGSYEISFTPNEVGDWSVKANWSGDDLFNAAEQQTQFKVAEGRSEIRWIEPPTTANLGETIEIMGQLQPQISGESISLRVLRPDGIAPDLAPVTTSTDGLFEGMVTLDIEGTWQISASYAGNASYDSTLSDTIGISVVKNIGKAIVVLGGGNEQTNDGWLTFSGVANYVYNILRRRTYTDDDIYYLSPSNDPDPTIDRQITKAWLEFAITDWAAGQVNANRPLLLYLISHNTDENFLVEKTADDSVFLEAKELAGWLDQLPSGTPVTIIIEACHSGQFIPELTRPGRTVIVSARADKQAKLLGNLSSFSKYFFDQIDRNRDLSTAFQETDELLKRLPQHSDQFPLFDANGDSVPNETIDFTTLSNVFLPDNLISLANEPIIQEVKVPSTLAEGESEAQIEVRLIEPSESVVTASILPPSFNPTARFDSWTALAFDQISLTSQGNSIYVGRYTRFTAPGKYVILIDAANTDGSAEPVQASIVVGGVQNETPWDVDGSGSVDVFDLVRVASQFGASGENLSGDVTGDGKIDVFDLVRVASHFGENTGSAAPAAYSTKSSTRLPMQVPSAHKIRDALADLEAMGNRSTGVEIAIQFLRSWLAQAKEVVTETALLPNYPNPFNPETWIPYQLALDAAVTIQIYDIQGKEVRRLSPGFQPVGFYVTQEKAAYWDGRDAYGERVSSGIYFYQLRAGDFRAARKLVIVK